MMGHSANSPAGREHILKMSLPACRIFSTAVSTDSSPIKYRFDPAAQAACGFGPSLPKGAGRITAFSFHGLLKHFQDKTRINC